LWRNPPARIHHAAFIPVVLPIASYQALRSRRDSLLYSGMAAAMYASVISSAPLNGPGRTIEHPCASCG
jgi:hypothetical protein